MEKRRYKRIVLDVPIHIQGMDVHGNPVKEETYTINISATGAYFISTKEYDQNKKLTVTIHLAYPLGNDVPAGTYETKALIVRVDNVVWNEKGELKKQNVAINYDYLLGSTPSPNPWENVID